MNQIAEDIRNQMYHQLYLFYGEEAYLRQFYLKKLLDALGAREGDMNYTRFAEKNLKEEKVIGICETLPFFAEKRVVLLDDTGLFREKHEKLEEYLKDLPEHVILILNEPEVDKRSRLWKTVSSKGCAAEFKTLEERELQDHVVRRLARAKKKIRKSTCEYFLSGSGKDLSYINCELDKLISFTGGREEVTVEDIEAVASPVIENRIFELVTAVAEGDRKKALEKYDDLLVLKEPPMRILYLLARQFDQLLHIRELLAEGAGSALIAEKLKMNPYVVKKSIPAARRYSTERLRAAVEDMVRAEEDVKTGMLMDRLSVELMIVKYAGRATG